MASAEKGSSVLIYPNEDKVAQNLAQYTANLSKKVIEEKGFFTVVLSGGSLISTMRYLTQPPYLDSVGWSNWIIFWVDERVVPLDDPASNYLLAKPFLDKVKIPAANIYPITFNKFPQVVADGYEQVLNDLVGRNILGLSESGFPVFDLMLLGMGPCGHVASLFPGRTQRFERKRWVTYITDAPKPPPPRITFTFPVINASRNIYMVVTGSSLADAVYNVMNFTNSDMPAAQISKLTWFLDQDAASELKPN